MYIPDVELHESESLEHAAALLERFGEAARVLAGGTDVLVDLKTGRTNTAHLVSINRISSLRDVSLERAADGAITGLRIGALTTIRQLDSSSHLRERFAPLRDATREMASAQVRNLATVGGNIASAVPCADLPPILMVMRASLILWSQAGQREVMLEDFFVGPRRTILRSGELLVGIRVPTPPADFGAAYSRFSLREGNAIAVAGVAAALRLTHDGDISNARIALGAVAPTPTLVKAAGAA
ncbi:MAG: FAD binding domain-containing protein, partial [Phycisphaerae bacterium]|nr:FAD binding domain-containing protein [Phycisphaerae bacterium]